MAPPVIERRIKELSIALEALSRIQGFDAMQHYNNISSLLGKAIDEAKEPYSRPPAPTRIDDDIPF